LTIAAIATAISFYRINKVAALLFVPYIAWLTLATALNYNIYVMNPDNNQTEPRRMS
jgi:benzodiazapine receptor